MLYCNDGDWVESLTALVEHHDGRLEIIDRSLHAAPAREPVTAAEPEPLALPQLALGVAEFMLRRRAIDIEASWPCHARCLR